MPGLKQLQLKNTANVAETERVRFKQQLGILTAAVDQHLTFRPHTLTPHRFTDRSQRHDAHSIPLIILSHAIPRHSSTARPLAQAGRVTEQTSRWAGGVPAAAAALVVVATLRRRTLRTAVGRIAAYLQD